MAKKWSGTWDGGRTYQTQEGLKVFVLRKMAVGTRYQHTLLDSNGNPLSEGQALAELALFDRDPSGYRPPHKHAQEARIEAQEATRLDQLEAVLLVADTVKAYLEADPEVGGIKGRHPVYRGDVKRYLVAWTEALEGKDLRSIQPREMLKVANQPAWKPGRAKRIAAIKSFCSFLIKTGQLDPAQDPSRSLHAPSATAKKAGTEIGYSIALVERLYAGCDDQALRDILCLKAKSGMHESEIQRIAFGDGILVKVNHEVIKGTIRFPHKKGGQHTVSVDGQTLAAAVRLADLGEKMPDRASVRRGLTRAALKLGLLKGEDPHLNLSELRHSFVAWCLEAGELVTVSGKGVPLAFVTATLGHTSELTTRKHYNISLLPALIKLPLKLFHPDDPKDEAAGAAVPPVAG